jgi:hypothetical protein
MRDPRTEPRELPAESGIFHRIVVEDLPAGRPPVRGRARSGRRLRQAGLAALVCVVAAAVLGREIFAAGPHASTPPPGPVVLISNVSFGTVTLNGKPLSGAPPLLLPLVNAMNVVTFSAAPFAPRTCRVRQSGPGQVSGDCLLLGIEHTIFNINGRVVHPSVAVAARFTGDDLPPDLYAAARGVVAAQLAVSGSGLDVPPGEPIATGGQWPYFITSDPAGSRVRATLHYGLFDDGETQPRPTDCGLSLCGDTLFYTTASASRAAVWNASPDAYYVWTFRDRYGNEESSLRYPVSPAATVSLTYDAAHGWQPAASSLTANLPPELRGFNQALAGALDAGVCGAGLYLLRQLTATRNDFPGSLNAGGALGCAYALHTPTVGSDGTFIWRFGVLLAADTDAHGSLPALPTASAAEVAEASR